MKTWTLITLLLALPVVLSLNSCGPVEQASTSKTLYGYELGKGKGYHDGQGGL